MIEVEAHCKTTTPMLSAGAFPQERFELRPASIKGALRFWWRAFHCFDDNTILFEKESAIFGGRTQNPSPPPEWKSIAAPFRIKVQMLRHEILQPGTEVTNLWGPGVRYCLWPIISMRDKRYYIQEDIQRRRYVLDAGATFKIKFTFPQRHKEKVIDVVRCLWLLENLGGIGSRTRRGAGCFRIQNLVADPQSLVAQDGWPDFNHREGEKLEDFIWRNIESIRTVWLQNTDGAYPSYTAFRPQVSAIHVMVDPKSACASGQDALRAMDAAGRQMQAYRKRNPFDEARAMHSALCGGGTPGIATLRKAQFGLPIIYNFRGPGKFNTDGRPHFFGAYTAKGIVYENGVADKDNRENIERRASPLLISCHLWRKRTPYAVLCHLPAPLLPDKQKIWLSCTSDSTQEAFPEAPAAHEQTLIRELISTDQTSGDASKAIRACFFRAYRLYPAIENGQGAPANLRSPDDLNDVEKRIWELLKCPPEKIGTLDWFIAHVTGKPKGQGKKTSWSCELWKLDESQLVRMPDTWYVRKKQLGWLSSSLEVGSLFYCTIRASDSDPENPENRLLYNFRKTDSS